MNNVILPGFNPDPSICKKDDTYYIATSTFEWYPGVQIHATKDLVNYELVARPLTEKHINLLGNDDSCGIWAPCLTYANNLFWLIFTDVKQTSGSFKDTLNYITTCDRIDGEWSEPVFINSSGFDPSLFHDDDGKKYILNMVYDHRIVGKKRFYGITIQEIDTNLKLIGEPVLLTKGTSIGLTEGPHILKKDNYYFLILAEGGTSFNHCVSIMRSSTLMGKYSEHPSNPIIGPNDNQIVLFKTGHGDIVEFNNRWYLVHLASRPIEELQIDKNQIKYCPLGRETVIQEIEWRENWPYVIKDIEANCDKMPQSLKKYKKNNSRNIIEDFKDGVLNDCFQFSRAPISEFMKIENNKLFLKGGQSLSSRFKKSLIAKRWESLDFKASTSVSFDPKSFQQSAGLINYYNSDNYTGCGITFDEKYGKVVEVFCVENGKYHQIAQKAIVGDNAIEIYCDVYHNEYSYSFLTQEEKIKIDYSMLTAKLSDDFVGLTKNANFTGAFSGIYVFDLAGTRQQAQFDYYSYIERGE